MTVDFDQLRETFERHESLAPDPDVVRAKARQIARNLQRQRWAVRATGTAVLGAGLVAGGLALPDLVHGSPGNEAVLSPASGGSTPARAAGTASPGTTHTTDEEITAYLNAGYDYNDAQQLARLWKETGDLAAVKAEAGGKLLAGETLPIAPSGTPATPQDLALQAFFGAGYDYNDAIALGKAWHETDISQVKIEAGQKLENGETLPVPPGGSTGPVGAASAKTQPEIAAFFDAGYTYGDAKQLAQLWHSSDAYHAKIEGGQKLLNGQPVPVTPSGTPASSSQRAQDAFFAAGYSYNDALQLARTWHETDITQVKAEAGKKLLDGEKLPITP